ncbi:MAG: hypothetical protein ACOX52_14565 [Verrucomicrobiota bacterium]
MDRSNFTAALCQHRNNTVAVPGFSCPNPLTRPFDTETDRDPDPELASPLTFSDDLFLRRRPQNRLERQPVASAGGPKASGEVGGRVPGSRPEA